MKKFYTLPCGSQRGRKICSKLGCDYVKSVNKEVNSVMVPIEPHFNIVVPLARACLLLVTIAECSLLDYKFG